VKYEQLLVDTDKSPFKSKKSQNIKKRKKRKACYDLCCYILKCIKDAKKKHKWKKTLAKWMNTIFKKSV